MNMAIGYSPFFALWLLTVHAIAVTLLYVTAMPLWIRYVASAITILNLLYHLADDVLRMLPNSWIEISLEGDVATVITRDGRIVSGVVDNMTVVCPYFVQLCIIPSDSFLPVSQIICPDAVSQGVFRELRVHLKYS